MEAVMSKIFGYCRISTPKQSIERQRRNIKAAWPDAILVEETYTGTKVIGREKWQKLASSVKHGDTIIFDSVSRMSRNSEDGISQYFTFFEAGVNLVFLKEPYINTDTYRQAMSSTVPMTGTDVDLILSGVNEYLLRLARTQIQIAFDQAEKEVADLHQRTKEGIETARLNGKQIGMQRERKLVTRKSIVAKQAIKQHCKDFGGSLSDGETMKLAGCSRNSYFRYKRELLENM
jgi:DNA invertase Pin-like site-specific DNA recombinase